MLSSRESYGADGWCMVRSEPNHGIGNISGKNKNTLNALPVSSPGIGDSAFLIIDVKDD
jgi:hypothetical protein